MESGRRGSVNLTRLCFVYKTGCFVSAEYRAEGGELQMTITRRTRVSIITLIVCVGLAGAGWAVDVHDTRMLSDPAISSDHIAFAYANDLWVAALDGSDVHRLTSHPGVEARPRFSPDGTMVAFTGSYDGNTDVYIVPVSGGVPTRLTWHPGPDEVQGFTPDGSAVLFTSPRSVHTRRHTQLFTVPLTGGFPTPIPIPNAAKATYSPKGDHIAYLPLGEVYWEWKNYRGGTASRIWLYDTSSSEVEQISQPEGRCNDTDPMWVGDQVYFLSDRNGEFNLFAYDTRSGKIQQLTEYDDFPVLSASAGGGRIIYEQAGYLHLFDLDRRSSSKLTVGVAADLIETRPRWVKGNQYIRNASVSPSGARAAFEFRGEIVTVPAEKGDPRNLTLTPGVHERSPAWSPDGSKIAFFSEASGEYRLHVASQDGAGEVETYTVDGHGFYTDPVWSPDGTKISYVDNSRTLYVFDLASGKSTKVASDEVYGPLPYLAHSWSPDSKWLAYARINVTNFRQVFIYSLASGESHAVSHGLSDAYDPAFDASGKYLYFFASTNAGPLNDWFSQANNDMEVTGSLYLAVLAKGTESPLAKESDEEPGAAEDEAKGETKDNGSGEVAVAIDFDGLDQRILALPVPPAYFLDREAGAAGQLFYLKVANGLSTMAMMMGGSPASLCKFDLKSREETTIAPAVDGYALAKDGAKALYASQGSWFLVPTAAPAKPGDGKLATDAIQVRIEPRAEWPEIFNEAWRINRDEFYDPNMQGADWPAMREKYAVFLPDLASRNDLNRLIMWMCSELSIGHHRVGGGDFLYQPESIPGGLLGADIEIDHGRYRFSKIFGGLNWNPELRSPLTEPGVEVAEGEYLLAVRGEDLRAPDNPFKPFENTAGQIVEITVGPNPDGGGSRTVDVVPIADEDGLRNRAWIEGNLKKVEEATGGRVGYVYVPNTTVQGFISFKRYFFPQTDKQALIIDERHNGGGQIADYYIDLLRRPYISHFATRWGDDIQVPRGAVFGPKVLLIDETAGSGGDMFPWMFRKLGLGTMIGRPTWGGLVGTLGVPILMDGGMVTAPNLGIWTDDGFVVENVGVPPDIEVEQLPKLMLDGGDPQLSRAIEVVLEQLEANPPPTHHRPPFPIRVRR